jgi:hypothetical protein
VISKEEGTAATVDMARAADFLKTEGNELRKALEKARMIATRDISTASALRVKKVKAAVGGCGSLLVLYFIEMAFLATRERGKLFIVLIQIHRQCEHSGDVSTQTIAPP